MDSQEIEDLFVNSGVVDFDPKGHYFTVNDPHKIYRIIQDKIQTREKKMSESKNHPKVVQAGDISPKKAEARGKIKLARTILENGGWLFKKEDYEKYLRQELDRLQESEGEG